MRRGTKGIAVSGKQRPAPEDGQIIQVETGAFPTGVALGGRVELEPGFQVATHAAELFQL